VCGRTNLSYFPLLQQPTALILHSLCELFRIEIYMKIITVNSVPIVSTFYDVVCYIDMFVCSPLKADSHIACRAHAVSLPCRAANCVGKVSFPFDLHSAAVSNSHLTCRAHTNAPTMPFFSRPRHSTAFGPRQGTASGLPARVRLLPANTRSSTKFVISSKPISNRGGQCETKQRLSWTRLSVIAAHCKKDDLLNCWTSSSDTSGYNADFHEGRGTIGAVQGRGMLSVN
jgi:hypothetical protein